MPLAERHHDVTEPVHLRMGEVPCCFRRRAGAQTERDSVRDIVDAIRPASGFPHPRRGHQRKCGEARSMPSRHKLWAREQARPKDRPVEIERRKMRVGLCLGTDKRRRRIGRGPDRRHVHDRRMPATAQASNNATVPTTWTRATLSPAPSCNTPTQFTTASISDSNGRHASTVARRTKSASTHCA